MANDITKPDPAPVLDLLEAFRRSKVMFAAVSLGVFDTLANGPMTLSALAAALKADADALERLLDACINLALLNRRGDRYEITAVAQTYLTGSSPDRLTGYINYSNSVMWKLWGNLEDAIREGTPRWKQAFGWDGPIFANLFHDDRSTREFLIGMHGYGLISSPQVVAAFDLSRFKCLVDLGGATGHLAVAACQRYPGLKGVVFDLAAVVPLAQEMIGKTAVAGASTSWPATSSSILSQAGDLYAVGRILHDWNEVKIAQTAQPHPSSNCRATAPC